MTIWQWLDKHGPAAGAFVGTLVIGVLLWARIGDVSDDVRTLRTEVASTRALDSGRIESIANRMDSGAGRLDTIRDDTQVVKEGINSLLSNTKVQENRLLAMEKIVSTGITDMSVVLRLVSGETSHLALTNFATRTHTSLPERANLSSIMIGAKLHHGGELRLYPPSAGVGDVLKANGWQPVAEGDSEKGYEFRPKP